MADRTPSRGPRSDRLQTKPYSRPPSNQKTPVRENGRFRGAINTVAALFASPFSPRRNAEPQDQEHDEEARVGYEQDEEAHFPGSYESNQQSRGRMNGNVARPSQPRNQPEESRQNDNFPAAQPSTSSSKQQTPDPISAVQSALTSFRPIDASTAIKLSHDFELLKQAQGGGPRTDEENRAIAELFRRVAVDSPARFGHGGAGAGAQAGMTASASDRGLGSPRRKIGSPANRGALDRVRGGMTKSTSMQFEKSRSSLGGAGDSSNNATPLQNAWKPESQASSSSNAATAGTDADNSMQVDEPIGISRTTNNLHTSSSTNNLALNRSIGAKARIQGSTSRPSGLSKSQSMFTLNKGGVSPERGTMAFPSGSDSPAKRLGEGQGEGSGRSRVNALLGTSKLGPSQLAPSSSSSSLAAPKKPVEKTEAAKMLESILQNDDAEQGQKAKPSVAMVNPYEQYRWNIGSSGSTTNKAEPYNRRKRDYKTKKALLAESAVKNAGKPREITPMDIIKQNFPEPPAKRQKRDVTSDSDSAMAVDEPAAASQSARFALPPKDKAPAKKGLASTPAPSAIKPAQPSIFQTSATDVASSTFGKRKQNAVDLVMANTAPPASTTTKITPVQINPDRFFTFDTAQITPPAPAKTVAKEIKKSDIDIARETPEAALPVFVIKSLAQVRDLSKGMPFSDITAAANVEESKLPAYNFTFNLSGRSLTDPAPVAAVSTSTVAPTPAPAPAITGGFTGWGAGAFTKPKGAETGAWTCQTCMCTSKAGSTKCDVCETPR